MSRARQRALAGLLCAAAALPAVAGGAAARLQVLTVAGGELLVDRPLAEQARWCVAWNHSVAGFAVHDCYVWRAGTLWLERSHQPDFAAGLGHLAGRGVQRSDGQGGYWIEHIDEAVPGNALRLRVGAPAVAHRVLIDGERIDLSARAARQAVWLRVAPPLQDE